MGRLRQLKPALAAPTPMLRQVGRGAEGQRIKGQPGEHLYHTARWKRLVRWVRKRDGGKCQQTGVDLIGTAPDPDSPVVDHIIPHEGDERLFFDPNNLQLVSKEWHDGEKQRQDRAGRR